MMKRSILAVVATTAAVVSFSCKKEKQPEPVLVSSAVEVTLGGSSATKAFGDDVAEDFEKELHSLVIYVYETGQDACVHGHVFTTYELGKQKAVFNFSTMKANTSYDFYAIANCTPASLGSMPTRTALLAHGEGRGISEVGSVPIFGALTYYNDNNFELVTTQAKRSLGDQKGFIMSGKTTVTTPAAGANIPTRVPIELRRTVAKVMVNITTTPEFKNKYTEDSKIKFTKAALINLTKNTTLAPREIEPNLAATDRRSDPLMQKSYEVVEYEHYQNLFFIYENGWKKRPNEATLLPELELEALFALDGVINEEKNIGLPIKYTIKLAGDAGSSTDETKDDFGFFKRNGSYLINVKVNGLTENEIYATVEVMNWETLQTQDITIGDKN